MYREKRKKLTYFFQVAKNLNSGSLQTPYLQASFRFNLSKIMVQNWTFTYDLCYAKYESDRVKWRVDVLNLNNDLCVFWNDLDPRQRNLAQGNCPPFTQGHSWGGAWGRLTKGREYLNKRIFQRFCPKFCWL